jgi:hypothetical protein
MKLVASRSRSITRCFQLCVSVTDVSGAVGNAGELGVGVGGGGV